MLAARMKSNGAIYIPSIEGIREVGECECLVCGETVTLKRCKGKRSHFAHKASSVCQSNIKLSEATLALYRLIGAVMHHHIKDGGDIDDWEEKFHYSKQDKRLHVKCRIGNNHFLFKLFNRNSRFKQVVSKEEGHTVYWIGVSNPFHADSKSNKKEMIRTTLTKMEKRAYAANGQQGFYLEAGCVVSQAICYPAFKGDKKLTTRFTLKRMDMFSVTEFDLVCMAPPLPIAKQELTTMCHGPVFDNSLIPAKHFTLTS